MADDNDDDLFADLYDNDEPVAQKQEEPEPVAAPAALPEVVTDPTATAPDALQNGDQSAPAAVGDGHFQDPSAQVPSWEGNDNTQDINMTGEGQQEERQPIGIKEDGKMFVGGLNWETTDESLKEYFTQFGEVAECTVMRDSATGRSRGFGFLTFKDPKDVNLVVVKEHYLDGKIIDPKRAIPREEQDRVAKIFVGGVSQDATEEDFKNYFSQYGRVVDATLMMDKDTGRPRGFGFVTFDDAQAVENTLRGDLHILGKPIEVKKAQPRGNIKEEENHGVRGGRGGRRGHDNFEQGGNQGGMGGMAGAQMQQPGMTPQMMALWWQQMQRMMGMYMNGGNMNGGNMMGGAGGMSGQMNPQMNPAMMQQMYLQMQQQQKNGGGPQGNNSPMAAMNQANGGGGNSPMPGAPTGPSSNGNRTGTPGNAMNAQQQQMFEQQKYEQQARGGGNFQNQNNSQWEGMYEDGGIGQEGGQQQGGNNFVPRGRGNRFRGRGGGNFHDKQPPAGPGNAPVGAPTGPKNATHQASTGGYRGGRGGRGRGFHPYQR